jgi:hypothetical protein
MTILAMLQSGMGMPRASSRHENGSKLPHIKPSAG